MTNSFAAYPAEEDRVNEYRSMESNAPTAETDVAGLVVLADGCSVPRLVSLLFTCSQ
jgi:hypothetical protein